MSNQKIVKLDKFKPRDYQIAFCDALENKGYKKLMAIYPRRAGKDVMCWNLMIRAALRTVGTYAYCLPTYQQCKIVIMNSITNDGVRFIDYIPKELIVSINNQELRITLINGSIIQLLGSDSYDTSLVGSNFRFIVLSEYGLADPMCYQFIRPILNANGGTLCVISTPRGKNHLFDLYNIASKSPEWFCQRLTLKDTKHMLWSDVQKEIDSGEISEDLARQEYLCDFSQGVEGSYYAKYIDKMRLQEKIGSFSWNPSYPVETVWDIGVSDSTCILFFQKINNNIYIIDSFEKNKEGLEFYAQYIFSKPYQYSKHWAPHDIAVKEFGSGLTRLEKARQLGIKFETRDSGTRSGLPAVSLEDGIEAVRTLFVKLFINESTCKEFIKAIENYRQEWDSKRQVYRNTPLHDKNSHYADALRYLALSLSRYKEADTSPEELDRRYREALYKYDHDGLGSASGFFQSNSRGF